MSFPSIAVMMKHVGNLIQKQYAYLFSKLNTTSNEAVSNPLAIHLLSGIIRDIGASVSLAIHVILDPKAVSQGSTNPLVSIVNIDEFTNGLISTAKLFQFNLGAAANKGMSTVARKIPLWVVDGTKLPLTKSLNVNEFDQNGAVTTPGFYQFNLGPAGPPKMTMTPRAWQIYLYPAKGKRKAAYATDVLDVVTSPNSQP